MGPVRPPVDAATFRRLIWHEAQVHAVPARRVTDLGDSILLLDPQDAEPFWNRLAAVRWPADADGFDRRLTEATVRFAGLARQPHIWLSPPHDSPDDLQARLEANGFEDAGNGLVMVTRDSTPSRQVMAGSPGDGIEVHRFTEISGERATSVAHAIVDVLLEAFGVRDDRRHGVIVETLASLADPRFTHYLMTAAGTPAAVARRATFDGLTYLSSIGTRSSARGRGLGRLITAAAAVDGFERGSEMVHLGVFADNDPAISLYARLGFQMACAPGPDMLLVR